MEKYFFILYFVICSNTAVAQYATFLTRSPDARGVALGMAGVATNADNFSSFYNPGKLSRINSEYGIAIGYAPHLQKVAKQMGMAALCAHRLLEAEGQSALGISMSYYSLGNFNFKDETGSDLYAVTPADWSAGVTYSRAINEYLSVGSTLRYINSKLATGLQFDDQYITTAHAIGGDIGVYYASVTKQEQADNTMPYYAVGVSVQNIGNKLTYTTKASARPQPLSVRIGGTYMLTDGLQNSISLTAEGKKIMADKENILGVSAGMEYTYMQLSSADIPFLFHVRGGVYSEKGSNKKNMMTFGVGVNTGSFLFNAAYYTQTGATQISKMTAAAFNIAISYNLFQ